MDWQDDPYSMTCGSADAEQRIYHKVIGNSGRIWLYADQPNSADNIYVSGDKNSDGFAGRTLSFLLDDGSLLQLTGPWHTNAESLFNDTGVDLRDKRYTRLIVGESGQYDHYKGTVVKNVLYEEKTWVLGSFNRPNIKAQQLVNELNKPLYVVIKTQGGAQYSWIKPKE